jgi:hypothetical protein
MCRRQHNRLVIAGLILLTAGSFVAIILFGSWIGDRPGFGLVPLISFVGWLFLATYAMAAAHRRHAENKGRYPPPPGSGRRTPAPR